MSHRCKWLGLPLLWLLTSCAALTPQKPQISLAALELADLNLSHVRMIARLELHNPNPYALEIRGASYRLILAGREIADGASLNQVHLEAGGRGVVDVDLSTSYLTLLTLSRKLQGMADVPYRLEGKLDLGGPGWTHLSVPILQEGIIPLAELLPAP